MEIFRLYINKQIRLIQKLTAIFSTVQFEKVNITPSLSNFYIFGRPLEVCVEGRRQGATKKCRDGGRLTVCKQELLRNFLSLSGDRYLGTSYRNIKASAVQYNNVWAKAKEALGVWTTKPPHLEDFTVT